MKIRFYLTAHGRSPVEDFLDDLHEDTKREVFDALSLLERGVVLAMPLSRNLSSIWPGLHELRFRDRAGQIRIFYYVKTGDAIYMIHASRKKTQETARRDIAMVKKRIKEITHAVEGS